MKFFLSKKYQGNVSRQCSFGHKPNNMILVLILGALCASAAEDLPEEAQPPHCNCTQLLQSEGATTDVTPTFPTTSFTCWGRYDGYYADIEVDCTIFHYCQTWHFPTGLNETVKWDFACPQSTIFNQKILSCTPPNISFDCQESPNYYWVNYNLTSTTTTSTPTTEFTTPIPNLGQQLIVGGIGPQSATIQDSATDSDFESTTVSDSATFSDSTLSDASSDSAFSVAALDSTLSVDSSDSTLSVASLDSTQSPSSFNAEQAIVFPEESPPASTDFEQSAAFSDPLRIPKDFVETAEPTFPDFFFNQPQQRPVGADFPNPNFAESGSGFDQSPGEVSSGGNYAETINFPI